MSTIGQIKRMIRKEEERKLKKYDFEHRTRTQEVKAFKGSNKVVKTITHFPRKKEESVENK